MEITREALDSLNNNDFFTTPGIFVEERTPAGQATFGIIETGGME